MSNYRFRCNFYAKEYKHYVLLRDLQDDQYAFGELRVDFDKHYTHEDINKQIPEFEFFYANSLSGRVLKKNISIVKEKAKAMGIHLFLEHGRFITDILPDGYLYAGNNTGRKTKAKADMLPEYYIEVTNYKKPGFIKTKGVKDIVYHPSFFNNHAFKDDFLYISYHGQIIKEDNDYKNVDEYIFGNDIISVLCGIEKYSNINKKKLDDIKKRMLQKYNRFCEEIGKPESKKFSFNEL